MTIYIDIIFLENIIMNSIILYATSIILKKKTKFFKIVISASIGAIYSIAMYLTNLKIYTSAISKIILSIIMIYIAFKPNNFKTALKQVIIFYLTSFIFGGCTLNLINNLNSEKISIKNGVYTGEDVFKVIILGAIFAFIIVKISIKIIKNKFISKDMYCNIKMKINEKTVETKAMIDTGNLVKEPITNIPVVIVESSLLNGIIPKEILDNLENILCGNLNNISLDVQNEYFTKLRCIPFSSLGKENGMLVGIKIPEILIEKDEEERKTSNIIIGLYDKCLTKKGEYRALVGAELI